MILSTILLVALTFGGDEQRAHELMKQGKYAAAAEAFAAAIAELGPSPERCYNLALAQWKAEKPDDAEKNAELVAKLSDGSLAHLRDGILGALRYEKAKKEQDLDKSLALAEQARDAFERGALSPGAGPELARNLDRALALVEELERKKKERDDKSEKQKDDKQKDDKQDENKSPDSRPQSQSQSESQSRPESQSQESAQSQPSSQPQPGEQAEPQPESQPSSKPSAPQPQSQPQPEHPESKPTQKNQVPGEQTAGELTPEQTKRLLDILEQMAAEKAKLKAMQRLSRPKVDRDW